jgi:hypothetical protein
MVHSPSRAYNGHIWWRNNAMLNTSNNEEKYLATDEIVTKEFKLKDQDVLTTSTRLFNRNNNNVRYIDYANISSIELSVNRQLLITIIGILLIDVTLCLQQFEPPSWVVGSLPGKLMWGYSDGGSAYIIVGAVLILIGFLWKTLSVKFKTAPPHNEFVLLGDKNTLDALARIVNERRIQANHSPR